MNLENIPKRGQRTEEQKKALRKASLERAQKKFREANREKLNRKQREARSADLPKQAECMREYRAKNPEKMKEIESRRVRPNGWKELFNAYRKEWAKKNRDKLREHAERRNGRKLGRLPRGTIPAIGNAQRWKCAACAVCLKAAGYHKDHITPLALGGEHDPRNIQLLCPPCNLSKGKKHVIDFMQSRGKLL